MKRGDLYPMVLELLFENPNLRDDDNLLETAVCRRWSAAFDRMTAAEFVATRDALGFPSRESIGRIRRLVQQNIEELSASSKCKRKRAELKEEMEAFIAHGKG